MNDHLSAHEELYKCNHSQYINGSYVQWTPCPWCTIHQLQARIERLIDENREAYNMGLTAYAWWKDRVEYVGTCGMTLAQAKEDSPFKGGE